MTIAIMQPTYLPWLGYFDLISQADVFVFLDSVQFERQSWQQRNRIKTRTGSQWLTIPVRHSFGQVICDVRIASDRDWRRQHYNSLIASYARAKFWQLYEKELKSLYTIEWAALADLNIHIIGMICSICGVRQNSVRASSLGPIDGRKADALVEVCRRLGGDTYLSPPGALDYLAADEAFADANISLIFQQYEHPVYQQLHGAFVPYMSAVDLLLNVGPSTAEVVASGRRKPRTASELVLNCTVPKL